ncbi:dynamitin domain-containing protein [Ditylenchus destructor]|nr:dynamitin domain-containing protein [Ditylenchus destructor]
MSAQKETVYETEDVPAEEPNEAEENFDDADVEKIHVDLDGAIKLFGNRLLNADTVDFSDALTNSRRKRGYKSGQYVLEIVGKDCGEKETVDQKFRRLRCEVEELMEEISKESEKPECPTSVSKTDLDHLNDLLKAALLKKESPASDVQQLSKSQINGTATDATKKTPSDVPNAFGLDDRIKRIENVVYGQNKCSRLHREPLMETVENLRIQVESLNPQYLDGVNNHLNSTIAKLSELEDKRSRSHTDDMEEKVEKLYRLISEWDTTCANVPSIVKRLHALSKLHEQAQEFSSKLNELTGVKQHIEKKIENQRVMLFELKRETAKFINEINSKIEAVEKKV